MECGIRKMGVKKGAFWTVLSGAICPIIRKVLVGRDLGFVDKCASCGANYGRELVSCCWVRVWGEGKLVVLGGGAWFGVSVCGRLEPRCQRRRLQGARRGKPLMNTHKR